MISSGACRPARHRPGAKAAPGAKRLWPLDGPGRSKRGLQDALLNS